MEVVFHMPGKTQGDAFSWEVVGLEDLWGPHRGEPFPGHAGGHSHLWDGHLPVMFMGTQADTCKTLFVQFSVRGLGTPPITGLPSGA